MAAAGVDALHKLDTSVLRLRTELSRERDALRHLQSWIELYKPPFIHRNAFPADDMAMPQPATCHDTTLAALAQLGALRMGTRRALISILSSKREYVLVESTRTMSLQSDLVEDMKDQTWLGTCSFPRIDGINDLALDGWRKARKMRDMPPDPSDFFYTESSSPHWIIISDLLQYGPASNRSFVKRARQKPRFYFSIPLRDHEGSVIGALSFLHDRPRFGVSAAEMLFCEDLSDTISQHLHGSIVRLQRQRSERLIQALGVFNNRGSSLRDWWVEQDNSSVSTGRGGRYTDKSVVPGEQQARLDNEFGVQETQREPPDGENRADREAEPRSQRYHAVPRSATEGNGQASTDRTMAGVRETDFGSRSKSDDAMTTVTGSSDHGNTSTPSPSSNKATSRAKEEGFDYPQQVKLAYARASNLLREALNAAGVAFVDAGAASTVRPDVRPSLSRKSTVQSRGNFTPTSSDEANALTTSDTDTTSDTTAPGSRMCKGTAFSTQRQSTIGGSHSFPFQITEREMLRLMRSYRRGKVFNFEEDGSVYSGSDENATSASGLSSDATSGKSSARVTTRHSRNARSLRKLLTGDARSIAFLPIWDDDGGRWRSCIFAWTTASARFFDSVEDITYLSAFAHSLRSEIAHLEALASDVAKGKFISSVSHELRSPLHGILAGIEMIQDSDMTPFQSEMATSVALAGRTLLDTVNHILDYSKISNLSRAQKRDRAKVDASRHTSGSAGEGENDNGFVDVDLSRLTEEVVESVVSAHRFECLFKQKPGEGVPGQPATTVTSQRIPHTVSVVLDIEKRSSWTTPIIPGAFTRIITNILGNALKYTQKGLVTVSLFTDEPTTALGRGPMVHLQVDDTGVGMSKQFLQHDLFAPFKQADSNSEGTGLGLSIVKEVAKSLKATLDVKSEIGRGTTFTVQFEAQFNGTESKILDTTALSPGEGVSAEYHNVHVLSLQGGSDEATSRAANAVADSVFRTASQWLECDASLSDGIPSDPRPSVCVVMEADLVLLDQTRPDRVDAIMNRLAGLGARILIIGRSMASNRLSFKFEQFPLQPVYILQPVGPRKLIRIMNKVQDLTKPQLLRGLTLPEKTPETAFRVIRGRSRGEEEGSSASYFQLPLVGQAGADESPLSRPMATIASSFEDVTTRRSGSTTPTEVIHQTTSRGSKSSHSHSGPQEPDRQITGKTVLLVEDNEINMRLLTALMKKQDLQYQCAVNGREAFETYQIQPLKFFLILMDMNMPVMNGFESTAQIREFERKSKTRRVRIAALTGVTNTDARTRAMDAGVDRYLTKPVRMKDLTTLVAEIQDEDEGG